MLDSHELRSLQPKVHGRLLQVLTALFALMMFVLPAAIAQQASPEHRGGATIAGVVRGSDGKPVNEATVTLEKKDHSDNLEKKTKADGAFSFSPVSVGSYQLSAGRLGSHSRVAPVTISRESDTKKVDLVLEKDGPAQSSRTSAQSGAQVMAFSDQPNFSVAGVTDW